MIVQGEDQVEHQGDILPQIENIDETGRVCDTVEYLNCIFSSGTHCTVEPLCTDTSLIRTPLYYGQFPVSRQNFHMFFLKQPL